MIKAILFDLDGTLLDTLDDIRYYVNATLQKFGYPPITREQARAYVGDGANKLIERSLPAECKNTDECYADFLAAFSKSKNERTRLFAGELECLDSLRADGYRLAVVTNKPQEATEGCIKAFFPAGMFEFVGGDTGMFPCKPDPTLARYAALSMRVSPAECAFVGDGEPDVLTAKHADMYGISALWGYRTKAQLQAVGATVFARDYFELRKILQNI